MTAKQILFSISVIFLIRFQKSTAKFLLGKRETVAAGNQEARACCMARGTSLQKCSELFGGTRGEGCEQWWGGCFLYTFTSVNCPWPSGRDCICGCPPRRKISCLLLWSLNEELLLHRCWLCPRSQHASPPPSPASCPAHRPAAPAGPWGTSSCSLCSSTLPKESSGLASAHQRLVEEANLWIY